jgi:hypothetical protein
VPPPSVPRSFGVKKWAADLWRSSGLNIPILAGRVNSLWHCRRLTGGGCVPESAQVTTEMEVADSVSGPFVGEGG